MEEVKYPIAELFDSIQGEGSYVGTRMYFIRIAGCSVGRPIKPVPTGQTDLTPSPYEMCTLYDGRTFVCDTDYRRTSIKTVEVLVQQVPVDVSHVSITGGEPLNRPLRPLIEALFNANKMVHIETSGTVYPEWFDDLLDAAKDMLWITCSPKLGAIPWVVDQADELKILIDEKFDFDKIPDFVLNHPNVYLSPVNGIKTMYKQNADHALSLIANKVPHWKLTNQMHKIWGVR